MRWDHFERFVSEKVFTQPSDLTYHLRNCVFLGWKKHFLKFSSNFTPQGNENVTYCTQ